MKDRGFKMVRIKLTFIIVILFFSCILYPGSALSLSINIDPSNIKITLKPEETKTGDITVQNSGSSSIKMKAYIEDWIYAADGSKTFIKPGSSLYSCSNWIKLNPETFTLAPKEEKNVSYTISAPKNASGGHVSVIFFESQAEVSEGIAVSGRIGTIVYQDTEGDIKKSGEIKEVAVAASAEGTPISVKITFLNKGNSHISAKPKISVLKDDKTVLEAQMRPINTLPGEERTVIMVISDPLKEGKYKAQVDIKYDNKTLKSQSEFDIKKKP